MANLEADVRELLARAHDEIMMLRGRIEKLEPKAHAYDTLAQLRQASKSCSQHTPDQLLTRLASPVEAICFAEDVAHKIRTVLDKPQSEPVSDG